MRRAILLGLILAAAPGTAGAQRVTVKQLEQILAASRTTPPIGSNEVGNADLQNQIDRESSLTPRLTALVLTERLTELERARIAAKYGLGPLTRSALELLADRSAFLDPPASENRTLPPPDADAQKTMVRLAGEFVFKTLNHLPNFFARMTTTQFDDGPLVIGRETLAAAPGMHRVGSSEREITFSEGKEVLEAGRTGGSRPQEGLESQGEFGTQAATVMIDLAHGTLSFHHWEQSEVGPVAVFRYAVPKAYSHYEVSYACRGRRGFHAQPAYHGSLSIDPATGALVRYTVLAESSEGDPITQVASAVEYGAVVLGGRRYFCPVRSLAFTVEEADACHESHKQRLGRPVAMLNRIVFSSYHKLGSEMLIMPGEQKPAAPDQGPEQKSPDSPQTPPANPPVPPASF